MRTQRSQLGIHLTTTTAITAMALVFFTVTSVQAQDLPEEDLKIFERHLSEGGQSLDAGDYESAIDHLDQARELIDHPRLSVSIAGAYLAWQRCSNAEREYEQLLERDDIGDDQRGRVEQGLAEAREDCVETATLRVSCEPASTQLRIDGDSVDCPFEGEVEAGEVGLTASADGFESHSETLILEPHEVMDTRVTLVAEEIEEPPSDWVPMASYGAIGLGSVMLLSGGVVDYRAGSRSTEIAQAQNAGDQQRLQELESDASSARKLNAILYLGGLTFVGGGLALQFLDIGGSDNDAADFAFGLTPTGFATTLRW